MAIKALLLDPRIFLPSLILLLYFIHCRLTAKRWLPNTIPWIGLRNEFFAKTRACMRDMRHGKEHLAEGYAKYSKHDKPFVAPTTSWWPEVMLPQSSVKWLLSQPDDVIDLHEGVQDALQFGYVSPHDKVLENPFHDDIVRRDLKRNLGVMTPAVFDELKTSVDELWGTDTENWKEIPVYDTSQRIIARTTNRTFVGLPLCRDAKYLHSATKFANAMLLQVGVTRFLLPALLKPLIGHFFAIPCHFRDWQFSRHLAPMINARLRDVERKERDPSYRYDEPNDLLQWIIRYAVTKGEPHDRNPRYLASRICIMNFAALHTSTVTTTNTLLDLAAADPGCWTGIREEAERVFRDQGGLWTGPGVAKLVRADSAVRETLRHTGLGGRGLVREVVAPGGVTLPDGTHLPLGARLGVAAGEIHRDPAFYGATADEYDAFRFSRGREALAEQGESDGTTRREDRALTMVTTSDTFLTFGHGRRACPGRFFASHEIKLLLAYVATHYDVRRLAARPPNVWISSSCIPPAAAALSVRRRRPEDA
ncbi:hypothetical protein B0A49_07508 [Cryomyces minteri]|uniref:Cytochrome P450 n=1 Tax=Cryomyces minteri TaxID=331657 RepID=A0A4U0WRW6_9PEZI|nr:hypothetical protein B0A49_07508 [Cryomyces minteri]